MDVWRKIEEDASVARQEERMGIEFGNAPVAPKFVIGEKITDKGVLVALVELAHLRSCSDAVSV